MANTGSAGAGEHQLLIEEMHCAGERLISALAEEKRLEELAVKFPQNRDFRDRWQAARRRADECGREYARIVVHGDVPADDPIRLALEAA